MSSQVTVFSRVKKSAAAEFAILYPRLVPVASVELPIETWCIFRSRRNQRTRLPNPAPRGFRLVVSSPTSPLTRSAILWREKNLDPIEVQLRIARWPANRLPIDAMLQRNRVAKSHP